MSTTTAPNPVPTFELRHRLARALEVGAVTNDEMAAEIGKGVTTIRNYLAGRTTPDRAVLRVWAMRCGVPFGWLAFGVESHPETDPDQGVRSTIRSVASLPAGRSTLLAVAA